MGGLHTLYNEINGTTAPANGHNESGIRGSIVTENAASDGNNFDEDLCTNDIGLLITMLGKLSIKKTFFLWNFLHLFHNFFFEEKTLFSKEYQKMLKSF